MSLFDNEEVMLNKLRYSPYVIKNVIVGYRSTSASCLPLVLILPQIYFNYRKEGETNGYDKAGISLYPNSNYFRYDKGDYLASLISLAQEPFDTLAFIHAEQIDASECCDDWENLILNLMANNPIKISDEVVIRRPENDLIVLVCTEKPRFLRKGNSIHYYCIDLTDHNLKKSEAEKEYTDLAEKGLKEEKLYKVEKANMEDSTTIKENGGTSNESSSNMKSIDWEERRFQMLKSIINGRLAGTQPYDLSINDASINKFIGEANRIIKRLKERMEDEALK